MQFFREEMVLKWLWRKRVQLIIYECLSLIVKLFILNFIFAYSFFILGVMCIVVFSLTELPFNFT